MGSLVTCPHRSSISRPPRPPDTEGEGEGEEEEEDEDFVRIPIEIRPRGRLGIKSARSWGRAGHSGGHSAFSLDLEQPELERARREWSLSIQSRDREVSKLRGRLEALELRHRRVCTELKALQRTCASLRRDRHQAVVAEQRALARARVFLGERDRARHQLALCREAVSPSEVTTASQAPLASAPYSLDAVRCLLDVDLNATPPMAVLERFVGARNWRLDSATASDSVLRLAVVAEAVEEADVAALRASAAPLTLHLLLLPPPATSPPKGFQLAPLERAVAICRRRAASAVAATPPESALCRSWRPAGLAVLLAEQRHLLRSELSAAPPAPPAAMLEHLSAAQPLSALRIGASERDAFLAWLEDRLDRPGGFYFASELDDASAGCPLALLRLCLGATELAPPSTDPQREVLALLSALPPQKEPLVIAFGGSCSERCADFLSVTFPPAVKVFRLEGRAEEAPPDLSRLDSHCLELLTSLDGANPFLAPWRDFAELSKRSRAIHCLLVARAVRLSAAGLAAERRQTATPRDGLLTLLGGVSSPSGAAAAVALGLCRPQEVTPPIGAGMADLLSLSYIAGALCAANEPRRAVSLLLRTWERLESDVEPEDSRLAWCKARLAACMTAAGRTGDAKRLRRQVGAHQVAWTPDEQAARVAAIENAPGAELALLWAVAKAWGALTALPGALLEAEVAPAEALVAWQAVAMAQAAVGQEEERLAALRRAVALSEQLGEAEVTSALRRHF